MNKDSITSAVEKLRTAASVAVITGAGVSAESGIPTFRGANGMWNNFNIQDLATPQAFRRNPKMVWEWYFWRMKEYGNAQPNPAHDTIAEMERHYPRFLLITQNVDTLHSKAGSVNVLEIHGNIHKARCTKCRTVFDNTYTELPENLVTCPQCGALARPHIVWFGESYDMTLMNQAIDFLSKTDVVIVVGTSGMVATPVHLTQAAIGYGAYAIDINPEVSEVSDAVHCHIREKAGIALPALWKDVIGTSCSANV